MDSSAEIEVEDEDIPVDLDVSTVQYYFSEWSS